MPRFVAMAGLRGYHPNYVETYEDRESALSSLIVLHDMGRRKAAELRRLGCVELSLKRYGNEYAEVFVEDCECSGDNLLGSTPISQPHISVGGAIIEPPKSFLPLGRGVRLED